MENRRLLEARVWLRAVALCCVCGNVRLAPTQVPDAEVGGGGRRAWSGEVF